MQKVVDKHRWVLQLHNVTVGQKQFRRIARFACGPQEKTLCDENILVNVSTEMATGRFIVVLGTDNFCVNALLSVLNEDFTLEIKEGHIFSVTDARPTRHCADCVPCDTTGKEIKTNRFTSLVRLIEESIETKKWIKKNNDCSFSTQTCPKTSSKETVQNYIKKTVTEGSIQIPMERTLPLYGYKFTKDLKLFTDVCHFPLLSYLTVEETFYWKLKITHPNFSKTTCDRLVNTLVQRLGLEDIRYCRVGSHNHRQLSTGEKSRMIIGLQVLDYHKKFLILKNPIDALDLLYSEMVFHLLHDFAHEENKCVIVSMSKPALPILHHVDDIIFLHKSHVVYAGPLNKLETFIQRTWNLEDDILGHPVEHLFDLVTASEICCERISSPRESLNDQNYLTVYNKTFQRPLYINASRKTSWMQQIFFLYIFLKEYLLRFLQTVLFLNKIKFSNDAFHPSLLKKKHQIHFFQKTYFLLLRSWSNSIHNPYKFITFFLAILQGLFLGFLFAGVRHKTNIDSFRSQDLQNPFEYFEKASFLLTNQDVQSLQKYNTQLVDFLVPDQKHQHKTLLTKAVFTNSTVRDFFYNFITCSYKNSDIFKVYDNTSDVLENVYPKPLVSLIQASRLGYTTYVQLIEPILMSAEGFLNGGSRLNSLVVTPITKLTDRCYNNATNQVTLPLIEFFPEQKPTLWKSQLFCRHRYNSVTNLAVCLNDFSNVTQGKLKSLPSSYLLLENYFYKVMQDIVGFKDFIKGLSETFFIKKYVLESIYQYTQNILHQCTNILFHCYQIAKAYKALVLEKFLQHCFIFFQNLYLIKLLFFHCIISFHTSITLSGALFSSFSCLTYQSLMSLFSFYEDHQVLDVEESRKEYHHSIYCLVQLLLDIPFQILTTTVFSVIMTGISGFFATSPDYSHFIIHILLCNLISHVFFEFAFLVSCLVKNIQLNIVIILYIHMLWFLFSGIVIRKNVTSFFPNLINLTSPFRYSYLAILENFYTKNTTYFGSLPIPFIKWVNGLPLYSRLHQNVLILFSFILIFRLLSIFICFFHLFY